MDRVALSKLLSYVLRHRPESVGVTLDAQGWVAIDVLVEALAQAGRPIDRETLLDVVRTSDKQRFAIEGDRIRANQGHSVGVDLGLVPVEPPPVVFHGTVERFLDAIRREGLVRGSRTHVHLSADLETAERVGARRGRPVVLRVDAAGMRREGYVFFRSENRVWLVEHVPPRFLGFP